MAIYWDTCTAATAAGFFVLESIKVEDCGATSSSLPERLLSAAQIGMSLFYVAPLKIITEDVCNLVFSEAYKKGEEQAQ